MKRWTWPKGKSLSESHKKAIGEGVKRSPRTHCKYGHLYDETSFVPQGRRCLICYRQKHPKAQPRAVAKRTCIERYFIRYEKDAQKRNLEWALNIYQFQVLIFSPCHYTGRPANHLKKFGGTKDTLLCGGIDRVDSSKGYVWDNCVPCCFEANMMKRDFSYGNFVQLCKEIAYPRMSQVEALCPQI